MKTFRVSAKPIVGEPEETREYVVEAPDEKEAKDIVFRSMMKREMSDALLDSPAQMMIAEEIDPTPKKITDLVENIDYYVGEMRKTNDLNTIPEKLRSYAKSYFANIQLDAEALKALAVYTIDKAYRVAGYIEILDNSTRAYFAKVIPRILDHLGGRGVHVFYIVDNSFGNDGRFEAITELMALMGMAVETPYAKSYEILERQINEQIEKGMGLMYIEKDASVNYLDKVRGIAADSSYLCIFRNKSSSNPNAEIFPSKFKIAD